MPGALLLLFAQSSLFGQPGIVSLGDKNAIVYDLTLDSVRGILAASLGDRIEVWDYRNEVLLKSWKAPRVLAIDFRGERLAGASMEGNIVVWNSLSGNEIAKAKVSDSPLTCIHWIDSTFAVAGSDSGEIIKFNTKIGKTESVTKTGRTVTALAVTGGGKVLFSANSKGQIYSWNDRSDQFIFVGNDHGWVRDIRISQDDKTLVSANDNGSIKRWRIIDDNRLEMIDKKRTDSWVLCLDYQAKGKKNNTAIGLRNGRIIIVTGFGDYHYKVNSMINRIAIIKELSPIIKVVIGTHGEGIKIISGNAMSFSE